MHRIHSIFACLGMVAALLGVTGCVQHEVTVTRNGEEVDLDEAAVDTGDFDTADACAAIGEEALAELKLRPEFAVEVANPTQPGCNWQGTDATAGEDADLDIWLVEPGSGGESESYFDLDGAEVGVWSLYGDSGRYVVSCGAVDIGVNYIQNHGPLEAEAALDAVTPDVVSAYGCAAG